MDCLWLEQTKTTKDWPSCREVSPDWKISQAWWKMQGVLKVSLQLTVLDHISVVPFEWHIEFSPESALVLQCRTATVPWPVMVLDQSWTRHLL